MKISFWSIGKSHDGYVKQGIDDFTKRTGNYFRVEWILIPPPKQTPSTDIQDIKRKEGELVLGMLQKDDYLIALDEHGTSWTSEDLSRFLQSKANDSSKRLVFLIGGAFGLSEAVLRKAGHTWSLSRLTFPHQLVRLILAEQVYRACTILRNEKYHHK